MKSNALIGIGVAAALAFLWWKFRPLTASVRTSESYDTDDYVPGSTSYPYPIQRFGQAIAAAEGYGVPGAIPTVACNPGDLVLDGWTPTLGSAGIAVFDSPEYGFARLHKQLQLIVIGSSRVYSLDDTIASMGQKWASGDSNWARNVAAYLAVPETTPLYQVLV